MTNRFRLLLASSIALTIWAQSPAAPGVGGAGIGNITINFGNAVGAIQFQEQKRLIFKNDAEGSPIQYVYEPAFLPQFNAIRSSQTKQLCLQVALDSPEYRDAAMRAIGVTDQKTMTRLVTNGMLFSLGPNSGAAPAYASIAAQGFDTDSSDLLDVCFDVMPNDFTSIQTLANNSFLRVSYGIENENVSKATCDISFQISNNAVFSNKINGPVTAAPGAGTQVMVTRNQLADAVNRGYIALNQTCRTDAGATTQASLAQDAAVKLLPVVLNQLAVQSVPWDTAAKELANFSFNGQDAGTQITNFLDQTANQLKNSNSGKIHVNASASANVLGLFGGSASGDVDTQHAEENFSSNDSKIQFQGNKFVPASLNVFTIKAGDTSTVAHLSTSQELVLGNNTINRQYFAPIAASNSKSEWPGVPVGAVVPFFVSTNEIANLKPIWLVANGQTVQDELSPLNGSALPDLQGRFVLGAPGTDNVIPNDSSNVNGTLNHQISISLSGTTGGTQIYDEQGRVGTVHAPRFTIDTMVDETDSANHNHNFSVNQTVSTTLPFPPYRRLVYMVRCRQ